MLNNCLFIPYCQTFIDIPPQVGERTPISAVYNPATREYILAAIKIAVVVLDEQLNAHHTDGFTHSRAVAKILYNPLFKVVITCGMDSIIINWDPHTGSCFKSITTSFVFYFYPTAIENVCNAESKPFCRCSTHK